MNRGVDSGQNEFLLNADTHNNSVSSKYTVKTFTEVLEDNEAILKNLKEIPTQPFSICLFCWFVLFKY